MSAIWTVKKRVSWDFLYLHRTFKYSKMQKHEYHDFFLPILAKMIPYMIFRAFYQAPKKMLVETYL